VVVEKQGRVERFNSLSLRERVRVRGSHGNPILCPLIRPSATFSLREKGTTEKQF